MLLSVIYDMLFIVCHLWCVIYGVCIEKIEKSETIVNSINKNM